VATGLGGELVHLSILFARDSLGMMQAGRGYENLAAPLHPETDFVDRKAPCT